MLVEIKLENIDAISSLAALKNLTSSEIDLRLLIMLMFI